MPARLKIHYRDRSDLPMSDRDIWLDYKNAKNPRMQVRILAELNETNKQTIEEIINEQRAIEECKLILLKEVEQVKQTEEERKAKKAAYMKEYWARKKAEKTTVAPVAEPVTEPITIPVQSKAPSDPRPDDSELIRKALQNFSIGLEEAIEDQKAVLAEAQRKLTAMEDDLKRCRELLGCDVEDDEG